MKEKIKESLDKMEENVIIAKLSEPTEWVSSMVAAKKRTLTNLEYALTLQVPVFSILDAKSAFWHFKLDEQPSYNMTFNAVFGRYCYLRMPYGISSGSEVHQQVIESLMEGTPCKVIVDDILVYGTNMAVLAPFARCKFMTVNTVCIIK